MEETSTVEIEKKFESLVEVEELPKRYHWTIDLIIQLFKNKPLGALGGVLVLILVVTAIFAPTITKFGPNDIIGEDKIIAPGRTYYFGTDPLARDVFSRIVYGSRISLIVGFGSVGLGLLMATIIGVLSGYIGGSFDFIVQRFVDAMMSFPYLVIMLTIMAILGPGLVNVILAFAIAGFSGQSRVIRSTVLAIKSSEYVLAARSVGCKQWVIIIFHILPNVTAPIIILATLGLGAAILAEASLSFLGFGVPPPAPSWGRMLSSEGLPYMLKAPWLAIFPGLAISVAVFGFNMLGDAMRDLLDPRLQGTGGRN